MGKLKLLSAVLFLGAVGCRAAAQVKVPEPVVVEVEKVVTKVVPDERLLSEVERLQAEVEELRKFDARRVCGKYCGHRGVPYQPLPKCK